MKSEKQTIFVFFLVLFICSVFIALISTGCSKKGYKEVDLSPASWPEGELEKYWELEQKQYQPMPLAEGKKGMVAGGNPFQRKWRTI